MARIPAKCCQDEHSWCIFFGGPKNVSKKTDGCLNPKLSFPVSSWKLHTARGAQAVGRYIASGSKVVCLIIGVSKDPGTANTSAEVTQTAVELRGSELSEMQVTFVTKYYTGTDVDQREQIWPCQWWHWGCQSIRCYWPVTDIFQLKTDLRRAKTGVSCECEL